jgi:ribose transport system ATP-binding protein
MTTAEPAGPAPTASSPVAPLRLSGVSKSFGANQALRDVGFELAPGKIHALVGANGSGKSTLIKVLAGVQHADSGELQVCGEAYAASSFTAAQSRKAGIRVVHQQDFVLPDLTVAENLAIARGFERTRLGRIRWGKQRQRAEEVLERFNIAADPDEELGSTRPATQAMIAIARALQDQEDATEDVLILDEPTAALPAEEATILFEALKRYAEAGQAILFVSHRLEEVLNHTESVTVLRDGRVLGTWASRDLTHDGLAEKIAGRSLTEMDKTINRSKLGSSAPVLLEVSGLTGGPVKDLGFSVRAGEVLGIGGLLGSGRSTVLKLLFGLIPVEAGEVRLGGKPISPESPRNAMRQGFAYVPEDRLRESAFPDLSVSENMSIAALDRYWRAGRLRLRAENGDTRKLVTDFSIKCGSVSDELLSLSGGNQQKVVLARWMRREPTVLLLDEPTQGVDVGARAEIYGLIKAVTAKGAAVVIVSSDAEEIELLCDRIIVLRQGRVSADLTTESSDDVAIERLTGTA